ncbi:YjbH domain-containing protein [Zunongwangia profunda]|uniref:YjbH domain-containing protein n=1 Tax=Zunongwangia profunda TaxID=398743 RepID=UPI00248E64F3|nr:YjbH domain-containing protein [Zunongwangia profunda]|tara:strand:- start:3496 stop:4626 length:1131 start_codon:yes stop_codon:yes gene_type:complete
MRRNSYLFVVLFLISLSFYAQDLKEALYEEGFENVLVNDEDDTLKIFFELREFRSPYHSMRFANDIASSFVEGKTIEWIPLHHNIPIGKYSSDSYSFNTLSSADLEFYNKNNKPFKNYRFNVRIRPFVAARFGYYSSPFETIFDGIIDTRVYLAKGLSAQTGLVIPIQNSLNNTSMEPRIAPSMISYFTQFTPGHFANISYGTYHNDRYGLDVQYRYGLPSKNWSVGIEAGLTGFYYQDGFQDIIFSNMSKIHFLADIEYHLPIENLNVRASVGQFIFQDFGGRVDLIKQFGLVDVGLFGTYTQNGATAGFQFAIPVFPGNIFKTKKVQLRTAEEFRWEYTYNNEDRVGLKYRMGSPRLVDVLRQYRVDFIQSLQR